MEVQAGGQGRARPADRLARTTTEVARAAETELSTGQSVLGALLIAGLLAGLHLAAPRIRKLPLIP
jgi:hypothetical protein